jgi:ABC-type transport system involved in multi-copper enzyme maturation permease subunit
VHILVSKFKTITFYLCLLISLIPLIFTSYSLQKDISIILSYSQIDKDLAIFWNGFLSMTLIILPIYSIILSSDVISAEFEKKTAPLTFTYPMKRSSILLTIILVYETIFVTITLISIFLFQIACYALFSYVIPLNGYLYGSLISLLVLNIWFSICFFVSVITRNTLLSLIFPAAYLGAGLIVKNFGNIMDYFFISKIMVNLLSNVARVNIGEVVEISKIIVPFLIYPALVLGILGGSIALFAKQDIIVK